MINLIGELIKRLRIEGGDEVVDLLEIGEAVRSCFSQQFGVHEGKNDMPEVLSDFKSPVLENLAGEGTELVQAVDPDSFQEFFPGDVPGFGQGTDREVKRRQGKEVGLRFVPGVFLIDSFDFGQQLVG